MTERLFAKPDLMKKARVQRDVREERNEEVYEIPDTVIYNNVGVMGAVSEELQKPTEEKLQEKRNPYRTAAVCLGLLTLLLVAGIIGLGIHYLQEQTHWGEERGLLWEGNSNLSSAFAHLQNVNGNITNQRDELQKILDDCSPRYWEKFKDHCYNVSTSEKTWNESKQDCENRGAHLVIITSKAEQAFITTLEPRTWIGLSKENGDDWKWVDGSPLTNGYWADTQPDDAGNNEDCVEIFKDPLKWNDVPCDIQRKWICEKEM